MHKILENKIYSISNIVYNEKHLLDKDNIFQNLEEKLITEAVTTIENWETYKPTPLIELDKLSSYLNINKIYYKDEGFRFDLKSFKALGGAFAVNKIVKETKAKTVSTATAGNHGRSVAWGAQRLGIKCKIFISEFVSEDRAEAMRNLGADVIRVKGNYDASLKECINQSKKNQWEIVQDVSWEGYKTVPRYIMAGYTIMIKEIFDKIKNEKISHVFLQAGVGGMAAAAIAGFAKYSNNLPCFITVEPKDAECVLQSIKNKKPTSINIQKESIMGGMSCGDVSSLAWEILKHSTNYSISISDEAIATTVALLKQKEFSNDEIIAGECGVPGVISLISAIKDKNICEKLKLNFQSNVLLIGCEGLTDFKMYNKLLKEGQEIIKNEQ
ncbi:diaminopropionate ammonia-lyase [Candidatus Pelagibacter sp. HIMB1321]|uniref:diaminopropionate ammonia-lyase n=1 Tax=Candidatus Pelagibacter sp. HIMB1321 TaxID=1388755 RepID=UPI000A07DF93|nr:diaminopropionate ammonia-lyase [Candidatus Pelagibacter sp. HIMB1321]SMF78207.1 diaminopropionate ammonia-lyase [Candidatus Pelagibacter sp. HIMB1321]